MSLSSVREVNSMVENFRLFRRKREKSQVAKSGAYVGWGVISVLFSTKKSRRNNDMWAGALSGVFSVLIRRTTRHYVIVSEDYRGQNHHNCPCYFCVTKICKNRGNYGRSIYGFWTEEWGVLRSFLQPDLTKYFMFTKFN